MLVGAILILVGARRLTLGGARTLRRVGARRLTFVGAGASRAPVHQDFVMNDVNLIRPEHPPSEPEAQRFGQPAIRPSGGSLSERRMDHFPSGAPTP
jgi:hypothetical protein